MTSIHNKEEKKNKLPEIYFGKEICNSGQYTYAISKKVKKIKCTQENNHVEIWSE